MSQTDVQTVRPDVSPDPWLFLSNTLAICSTTVNIYPTGTDRQNIARLMLKLRLFLPYFCLHSGAKSAPGKTLPVLMQGKRPHLNARSHRVCAAKLVVRLMLNDSSCESRACRETRAENTHAVELWRPDGNGFAEDIFNRPALSFCHVTPLL